MTSLTPKPVFFTLLLAVVLVCTLASYVVALEHAYLFDSPVFSDAEYLHEMPQDWVEKPITHPEKSGEVDLYMTLSYQIYDVLSDKIRKFSSEHNFTIMIEKASCSTSTRMLMQKEIDIASFCCSPSKADRLPGVQFHTAGIAPVAIIVNKDNPVEDVSLEDLMKIFRGEIVNWSQLGGEDMLIQPVARLHCKIRPGRWRPLNTSDELSPSIMLVGAIDDNLEFISRTKGSIGYESLQQGMDDKYTKLKKLSIDGIGPSDLAGLAHGDYPYYRSYTFTVWEGQHLDNNYSGQVIDMINKEIASFDNGLGAVSATVLRKNGWKFSKNELVGEPE
jgi:phosphate transport system substrate-binding protein